MFALLLAAALGCPFPVPTHTPCEPVAVEQSHDRGRGDSAYERGYRDALKQIERERAAAARAVRPGAYTRAEYEGQIDARVYGRELHTYDPGDRRDVRAPRGPHFDDRHHLRPGHHDDDGCDCDCDETEDVVWVARMSQGGAYGGGGVYTDYSGGGGGGSGGGAASFNGLSYAFAGGSGLGGGAGGGTGTGTGTGTGSGTGTGTGTGTATSTSTATATASINASINAGINIHYGGYVPPVTPPGGGCNHGCGQPTPPKPQPQPQPCHTCTTGGGYGGNKGGGFSGGWGARH